MFYIVEKDKSFNDFMIFKVKSKKIFRQWKIVPSLEDALSQFSKSKYDDAIIANNDLFFSFDFNKIYFDNVTLYQEPVKLSDSEELDALYVTKKSLHLVNQGVKQTVHCFFSKENVYYRIADFSDFLYDKDIDPLAESIFKNYLFYMNSSHEVNYNKQECFERAIFHAYKPFLIFIHLNNEIDIINFCTKLNKSNYPYFRVFVHSNHIIDLRIPNVQFFCNKKTHLVNRFTIANISNKNEIIVFPQIACNKVLPDIDLYKLNKTHTHQELFFNQTIFSIKANYFRYSYPEHLLIKENPSSNEDIEYFSQHHAVFYQRKPFLTMEKYLWRKDIDNGLKFIDQYVESNKTKLNNKSIFQLCLSKISFLAIKEDYKSLEDEIVRYLVLFKEDYLTIKNIFLILLNLGNKINENIHKIVYLKYNEFKEEADEQKLFVLLKIVELKQLTLDEMNKVIKTYSTLKNKPYDLNKAFLTLTLRKISLEFNEASCLSDLMAVVTADFKQFTRLESEQHFKVLFSVLKEYYPELIIHICDYVGQYIDNETDIIKRRNEVSKSFDILNLYWEKTYNLSDILNFHFSNFQLSYHGLSSKDIFKSKSKFVRKICPELNYKIIPKKNEKIKVGFISAFLNRRHSVYKDRHMIIAKLSEDFDVYFFTLDDLDKPIQFTFGKAKHMKLPSNLKEMRDEIAGLNLDVLVYCEIGMHPIMYYLAHMKLAKYQLNTWGHSDTSGIDTIDYFMTSKYYDNESTSEKNYSEKSVMLNSLCTYYINPIKGYDISAFKSRNFFGFSDKVNLYLCPQSLFKIHPKYDSYMFDILIKDPEGIIVIMDFVGKKDKLLSRFEKENRPHLSRIHFIQGMPHFEYLNLINICDVMLDPFPFGGCNSSLEAFSLGKVVVTRPSELINGRFTSGFLKKMGMPELICRTKKDYVELAVKVAKNKCYQEKLKQQILRNCSRLFEEEQSYLDWKSFIQNLDYFENKISV
jgi:predicted O-linked N-acetylglucosamine transferase (SPINDLY family)